MSITLKRWHGVAEWTWCSSNSDDDICGICRSLHDGCAPDVKFPGDDSPVVWGSCGHAFHLQCIQKWLTTSAEQRCPMCRRGWSYEGATRQRGSGDEFGEDERPFETTPPQSVTAVAALRLNSPGREDHEGAEEGTETLQFESSWGRTTAEGGIGSFLERLADQGT